MPGFHLVTSNRMELLSDRLADDLRQPLTDVFARETIVVQSLGMGRWLRERLAQAHQICANVAFPFPRSGTLQWLGILLERDLPNDGQYQDQLLWHLYALLGDVSGEVDLAPVRRYLGDDVSGRKRFQLASRLAALFDQYAVYRSDWIRDWEKGQELHWQARLWRALSERLQGEHWTRWMTAARERLETGSEALPALPERLSVFGISTLPPEYIEWLALLSRRLTVRIYLMQPCREYWADIRTGPEIVQMLRRADRTADEAEILHLERGHRLLAMLGRQGKDFLRVLMEHDLETHEVYHDPVAPIDPATRRSGKSRSAHCPPTLLQWLQQDILDLRDRTLRAHKESKSSTQPGGQLPLPLDSAPEDRRPVWSPDDDSIRVHACHGPLRELEVLRDHILHWLESDPTLTPRDILVMAPELQTYAALIQGVFGADTDEATGLPYSVADRGIREEDRVSDAFLRILQWADRPVTAGRVAALLENPSIQARFLLDAAALPILRTCLLKADIRWGLDAQDRGRFGVPELAPTTWRHGLDRLLLGYAMAPDDPFCVDGVDALDWVEGENAERVGNLAVFISTLTRVLRGLQAPRTLADWAMHLNDVLDDLFPAEEPGGTSLSEVRAALRRLARLDGGGPVPRQAVLEQLEGWLSEDRRGHGFLGRGVTFCAMKPMRSIPARVVCVLGLNDQTFPRRPGHLSFDRIQEEPRPGDSSRESDDRYLFLETLLSARDRLHLSYVGQSIRDNAPVPPSVVVSELLDYLVETTEPTEPTETATDLKLRDQLLVRHRLQSFHPDYRKPDAVLFTYGAPLQDRGGLGSTGPSMRSPVFSTENLDALDVPLSLQLNDLTEFLLSPSRFFARERLGIKWIADTEALQDTESFSLDNLQQYKLMSALLDAGMRKESLEDVAGRWSGTGLLPLGTPGRIHTSEVLQETKRFLHRLQRVCPHGLGEARTLDLTGNSWQIQATLIPMASGGAIRFRPGSTARAGDRIRLWLEHLVLAASGHHTSGYLVLRKEIWELTPLEVLEARGVLDDLCELYRQGCRAPLPFFPETSLAYVSALDTSNRRDPEREAQRSWYGEGALFGEGGESRDPFIQLCFGHHDPDPLDDAFRQISRRVLEPLLNSMKRLNLEGEGR